MNLITLIKKNKYLSYKKSILYILSFCICAFAQPAWVGFLGYFAYFFGYSLFFLSIFDIESKKKKFLLTFIWFFLNQAIWLSWFTTTKYQGPLILLVYFFVLVWFSLQFGVLSFFVSRSKNISFFNILLISSIWTIFEWSRLFFLCGFSFNQLGGLMGNNYIAMQLSSIVGIYGLSFFVIFLNLTVFKSIIEKSKKTFILAIFLAMFPYVFGFIHIKTHEEKFKNSKKINAVLMQTSILPEQKNKFSKHLNEFIHPLEQWKRIMIYINQHKHKKIDMIVLPEAALPYHANDCFYPISIVKDLFKSMYGKNVVNYLDNIDEFYTEKYKDELYVSNNYFLKALSLIFNAEIIAGLEDFENNKNYNAAFYFDPNVNRYLRYEKQILVPMGEYIPFDFLKKIAKEKYGIVGSFINGNETKIFSNKNPLSISICYEETFNEIMRKARNKGAQIFVNITNDAWFYKSKLFKQHFYHSRFRSVENGLSLIRASNNGITGAIDPFGRIIKSLSNENDRDALFVSVPIFKYFTLYSFWGNSFIISISFSIISLFIFKVFSKKIKLALKEIVS
ncbi:MAG: Apolipoprotein N-acyltransferase [Candidatus Anoxychlamydiales bacterium]|nr:Apolipoprotein N-acyltransferase [Candidatus Anoxychlamydiales bacterium]